MIPPEVRSTDQVLAICLDDARVIARYNELICPTPTDADCLIWTGALSGRGHGRFWLGEFDGHDRAVLAHRFAYGIAHGHAALAAAPAIQHRCDEACCQNPAHLIAGTIAQNTQDWIIRRNSPGSPLRDTRGALGRAQALRAAARLGEDLAAAADAGQPANDLYQLPLF